MKLSSAVTFLLLTTTIQLNTGVSAEGGVWLTQKPHENEGARKLAQGQSLRRLDPTIPVTFGSGNICPPLPAGRGPTTETDGWASVMEPNDDGSTGQLALPFSFSMYGSSYDTFYINNNGNLSFDTRLSTFTAQGFPIGFVKMIAPFWSDVDTRNDNGRVYMKQVDDSTIAVAWDHVGYFPGRGDKLNTFQVMISDGTNAAMGPGNNVCFCYYEMEWTTGSASSGVDGFGGSPATVGSNNGDGENYAQIGRFDSISTLEGSMMNVDSLNGQDICFSVGGGNNPPIPIGFPSNGFVELQCDDFIEDLVLTFAAPESDQTTSLQVIPETDLYGMIIDVDDGALSASATINWNPTGTGPFSVTLQFVAQDSEGGETIVRLTFNAFGSCQEPGGGGDPHFETWSGQKFSFHGECDLVLIQDPEFSAGKGLHVHGRTKIHHDWSAFEGAAVKIGEDVFEIHGKDDYWLNGESNIHLPAKIGGYEVGYVGKPAEHVTRYSIRFGNGTKVILKAYDEFVWVMVEGNDLHKFEGSHGLLGTYQGVMYGRDGKTVYDDPIAFGQEWQVRDTDPQLFHILEGPQFPEKCLLPTHPKLNVDEVVALAGSSAETLEAVKKACEHARAKERNDCIADVLATKDFGMAAAY